MPHAGKNAPCAASNGLGIPILLQGLPQDGETQLEVYDRPKLDTALYGGCDVCQSGPYDPHFWSGSSGFDWTDPTQSTRPFHWATTAPGTTDGRWQLSAAELPAACHPKAVIASGSTGFAAVPLAPDSTTSPPLFTVDFGPLAAQLDTGTAYHLRVVPVDASGACTGPASPSVQLSYQPPPPAAPTAACRCRTRRPRWLR